MIPLHKKGNTSNMDHYRPVVLSYLCKIAEKLISTKIYDFVNSNIFSQCQYDNPTNVSTELLLLSEYTSFKKSMITLTSVKSLGYHKLAIFRKKAMQYGHQR